jgi:hypothetical protein
MAATNKKGWLRWAIIAGIICLAIGVYIEISSRKEAPLDSELTRPTFQSPTAESNGAGATSRDPSEMLTLASVLELARELKEKMKTEVVDYTATVVKRERIKGKLGSEDFMRVKIRHADAQSDPPIPFSVFLTYVSPSPNEGREVIWIQGSNGNKLLTHQFGIQLSLPTNGLLAMMGNKYPITDIGILNLAEKLIEKGERDVDQANCQVEIVEDQEVQGRLCQLIQVTHPEPLDGLDFHVAQIFIDNELRLPIRYAAYLWPPKPGDPAPLEEEYTYLDLQVNVGLTDIDFDASNPDYHFPK